MTTAAYNPQQFSIETKALEQKSFDLGVSKAQQLVEGKTHVMAHRASRKICDEAFENFKTNIQATFPYDDYKDLIFLTLKSRENFFFIDLKERVISILRNPEKEPPAYPSDAPAK